MLIADMNRRQFLSRIAGGLTALVCAEAAQQFARAVETEDKRPNILFVIADDQSWCHTSFAGDPVVKTPAFDRVAREGVYFSHAFCCSPSCTPSRGAVLTGQHIWRLEDGANLVGTLPKKFAVYPDILEQAGYFVGFTGKGWSPGNFKAGGRTRNPAGPGYQKHRFKSVPYKGLNKCDYASNLNDFLKNRPKGKPFCFWYGSIEPHRGYERGSGVKSGKRLEDVIVPKFFPDVPEVRSDILDYYVEIEWFDKQLNRMIEILKQSGELDNTLIVVTSDNGMPFPRCKTNLYDYGVRMPLAIRWLAKVKGGRVVDDFVNLADMAPTFLQVAGLSVPKEMTGRSLMPVLLSRKQGRIDPERDKVFVGRERHGWNRDPNVGYPMRAVRTHRYLYIRNLRPERRPGFDIDHGPTRTSLLEHRESEAGKRLHQLWWEARPAEELYDVQSDPYQVKNLAQDPEYKQVKKQMGNILMCYLKQTGDPRALGNGDVFDTYRYFGRPTKGCELFKQLRSQGKTAP